MANIFDMVDVWNDAGTTFTSIKMNVTDTASNAASLLMDLQVGGVSATRVNKQGRVIANSLLCSVAGGTYRFLATDGAGPRIGSDAALEWTSIASAEGATRDLKILRDAANTLAQRNGTAAQAFNLYNTYTDASNYERGFLKWNSNVLQIGAEAAGTGTATRSIAFVSNATTRLSIDSSGHTVLTLGRSLFLGPSGVSFTQIDNQCRLAGGSLELTEQTAPAAPAANNVRIYAEDDGAGKTRLMALFATGAAQQIAIEP
jgi:hypothetical protein